MPSLLYSFCETGTYMICVQPMLSLVYPSQCYTNENGCSCNAQSAYTDPWLTLWRLYTTTSTEEQPHAYNDACMIDGRCGSSHRRHRFAITLLHASCGLVMLKPSTIVDNQHMLAHGVRATHTLILRARATEGHYANPLPFKATVSETKVQDPPSHHAKASQMPTPTTSLFTTIKSG